MGVWKTPVHTERHAVRLPTVSIEHGMCNNLAYVSLMYALANDTFTHRGSLPAIGQQHGLQAVRALVA